MKCSQCKNKGKRYPISEKEVRVLCDICVQKHLNKDKKETPNYTRASKLYHGKL